MRTNDFLSPNGLFRAFVLGLLMLNVGCATTNGWVANRTGMRQYNRGHYAQARHRFAHAVARDPWNPDYRHNLAMAIQKQGDAGSAEKIFRHNLTIDAMHQPTYHSLAQLMITQGRAPEAQDLIAGWSATQPYVPEANIEMAWIQQQNGDVGGAEQSLQTALKADPTNPIALAHMGQLYQGSGRTDQAVAYYQRSLAAKWDQPEVQSRLATIVEASPTTRSAMMQNPAPGPMMAGGPMMMPSSPMMTNAPVMMGGQMASVSPVSMGDPMMASAPMMVADNGFVGNQPMAAQPTMSAEIPFGSDPQATSLEDPKSNPEPRKKHHRRRKNHDDPTIVNYPLPDFNSNQMATAYGNTAPNTAWVPSGTIGGQPAMAYQVTGYPANPSLMTQTSPQLMPPQLAESIPTPYVSNSFGPVLVPQADPAHFSESNSEMTASGPTVDPR